MKPLRFAPLASALLAAIGTVALGAAIATTSPGAPRSGEQVVQYQCVLCHGAGVGGAPKIGDGRAWSARAPVGIDNLVRSATKGRGAMPPSGGLSDLSEPELRAAIAYMLRRSGIEPRD